MLKSKTFSKKMQASPTFIFGNQSERDNTAKKSIKNGFEREFLILQWYPHVIKSRGLTLIHFHPYTFFKGLLNPCTTLLTKTMSKTKVNLKLAS